jgi:Carboxypeptidase regulatory-like domain
MNRPIYFLILIVLLNAVANLTKPVSGSKDEPLRDGVITGRVILDDGSPAEGALVSIMRVGIKQTSFHHTTQHFNTDSDGNFKATGLVPGVYRLGVSLRGYVTAPSPAESPLKRIGEHVTVNLVKGGVITGVVTDARGEPRIGEYVHACRVRDAEGSPLIEGRRRYSVGGLTDDRGIYRIYGLNPGNYIVRVHPGLGASAGGAALRNDAPTYHPSSTRGGAAEITVHAGEEINGVNIQHRSQPGYAVTGILSGEIEPDDPSNGPRLALFNINSSQVESESYTSNSNRFVFYGVPDGDYQIFAHRYSQLRSNAGASPVRIQVSGTDVTGIELKLFKLSSISGRVSIEGAKTSSIPCQSKERLGIEEIYLSAKSDEPKKQSQNPFFAWDDYWSNSRTGVLNEKWEFALNNLEPGRYRIVADLPGENWYVRAINQPAPGKVKSPVDASRAGIAVKRGENLSGIEVIVAEGAASLSGRIVYADERQSKTNKTPLSRYRVHLIPAESTAAENLLRYFETPADSDGSFTFKKLAPGKYRILAKPLPEGEPVEGQTRPAAWDADELAKMRREAEKDVIELQQCQRVNDYVLRANIR